MSDVPTIEVIGYVNARAFCTVSAWHVLARKCRRERNEFQEAFD